MGLFAPNGIQKAIGNAISFDTLTPLSVNIHPASDNSTAYSPNNARFQVTPHREISTFWSAAVSDDKKHAIVSFHICANSDQAEQFISHAVKNSHSVGNFLETLYLQAERLHQKADIHALKAALETIAQSTGIQVKSIHVPQPIAGAHVDDQLQPHIQILTQLS